MPQPQTQTPEQFETNIQNGITSQTSQITDFSDNTPEQALTYSLATQFDFVQTQNEDVALLMRGKTSFGSDLDSFVGDYVPSGFEPRLEAEEATTTQTFYVNQPNTVQGVILVGTIVQNPVNPPTLPVQFQVIADPTNPNYNASLGGYVFAVGETFLDVLVQCLTPGTIGNLNAGSLTIIASPNVPADSTSNTANIENGENEEQDGPLFQRWSDWMAALGGSGTDRGLCAAVAETQVGIAFTFNDRTFTDGTPQSAFFTICADDGSGAIPQATLNAISANLTGRSAGISFGVVAPTNVTVSVAVSGTVAQPSFDIGDVRAAMQTAIVNYVNGNGPGGSPYGTGGLNPSGRLWFVGLVQLVASFIGTNPGQGLLEYSNVTLNGLYQDVPLTNFQLARTSASSVVIS